MNLGFVILYVKDMNKLTAFYRDTLGMTVMDAISSATFMTLKPAAGAMIGLQDAAASQLPPGREKQPGTMELSFEVDDVDATWKSWKEKGVEMVTEPLTLPFGRYFLAKDPEGHYLSAYRFAQR